MSAEHMMQTLWDAARPHLTNEQLAHLDQGDRISAQLTDLAKVMEGIGCLIATDANHSGNFQSHHDVPGLMFALSKTVESLGHATFIASEANFILQERKELAAESARAKVRKQRMAT